MREAGEPAPNLRGQREHLNAMEVSSKTQVHENPLSTLIKED